MSAEEIEEVGREIANLIAQVNIDFRGNVLKAAAKTLRVNAQWFTASVLETAARHYEIHPVPTDSVNGRE